MKHLFFPLGSLFLPSSALAADARAAQILVEEGREPRLRSIQGETEAAAARANLEEARARLEQLRSEAHYFNLSEIAAMRPKRLSELPMPEPKMDPGGFPAAWDDVLRYGEPDVLEGAGGGKLFRNPNRYGKPFGRKQ